MKNKKIIFEAAELHAEVLLDGPTPSIKNIPKWFREQKVFSNSTDTIDLLKVEKSMEESVSTYKLCVPITDSMSTGYMVTTPADILVINVGTNNEYIPEIRWKVDFPIVDTQLPKTLGNYPIPTGFNPMPFRWIHDWKIITPSGYSTLFMHPIHRHDLTFFTLSGVVDTDMHPNKILLPFFIKENFEGLIKEGTPIAQFLPFKRDNWKLEKKPFSIKSNILYRNAAKINYLRTYKNKFWTKKKYE
jgi:hypothetical protein